MTDVAFDTVTRRAGLLAASAAGLAGLTSPLTSEAKKKNRKKKKFDTNKFCKQEVPQCDALVTAFCAESGEPELCLQALLPCCDELATCDFAGFFACQAAAASFAEKSDHTSTLN